MHRATDTGRCRRAIAFENPATADKPHLNWSNGRVREEPLVIDKDLLRKYRMIDPPHSATIVESYVRENPPYATRSDFLYPYNRPAPAPLPTLQSPKGYVIRSESKEQERQPEAVPVTTKVLFSGIATLGSTLFDEVSSDSQVDVNELVDDFPIRVYPKKSDSKLLLLNVQFRFDKCRV